MANFTSSKILKRISAYISFLLFFLCFLAALAFSDDPKKDKRILILNSYHPGREFADNETSGILSAFQAQAADYEIRIEYLDTKHFPEMNHYESLKNLMKEKYKDLNFSIIIVQDDPALIFISKYREELFPGVPVVFCGISNYNPSFLSGQKNMTGVLETIDVSGTVEMMQKLHPELKEIYVIHDYTISGLSAREEAENQLLRFRKDLKINYLENLSFNELLEKTRSFSSNSLILLLPYSVDKQDRTIDAKILVRLLNENSAVPIYGIYDEHLGMGIIGGSLIGGKYQGMKAAEMSIKLLNGEKIYNLPIFKKSTARRSLDYQIMHKYGLSLPSNDNDYYIINKPENIFEKYRSIVTPVLLIFLLLIIIIFTLSINIIKRKRAESLLYSSEEKLIEKEKYYRALIEYTPGIISVYNSSDSCCQYFSPSLTRLFGYNTADFVNKNFHEHSDLIHKDDLPIVNAAFYKVMRGRPGTKVRIIYRYKISDGSYRIVESFACNYSNVESMKGSIFHTTDITDRYLAEEALAKEKEQLSITLRSIGDGVITTDMFSKIVLVNKSAEILTGWTSEEAAGKELLDVFHIINEKTGVKCEDPVKRVIRIGGIIELESEIILISKTGEQKRVAESIAPMRDKESKMVGTVLVFRDVTEKKRMEDEIVKKQKLDSVGILAGGIAHDFNNILTSILGNIQVARMKKNKPAEIERLLLQAEKASFRAKNLTLQLLTFSKGGSPVLKTGSIQELLKDTADFSLRGSSVTAQFFFQDNLWMVIIDEGQISQVIQNIVLNAKQAMPSGGTITIKANNTVIDRCSSIPLPPGKYVKISISDQGTGITMEHLARIFDPYFTTKDQGHGLGLAVCYSIMKNHNGYIYAESEYGKGTEFIFFLPVSDTEAEKTLEGDNLLKCGTGNILLMDDDEMIRDFTKTMLQDLGYDVGLAKNGEEAVQLYKSALEEGNKFNLVILDLTIPGGLGAIDTLNSIKEFDPDIKAIVSSGYSNANIIAGYEKFGFKSSIVKPFNLIDLSVRINKAMEM